MNTRPKVANILCGFLALLLLVSCTGGKNASTATSIPATSAPTDTAAPTFTPTPAPKDTVWLAHYMPWYQNLETSGNWGWHWSMNHFAPSKADENGRREIASHYYPLIGPYDSSDVAALEYQVATMKLSGIDGVIVDWYGNEAYNDYGLINESTQKLFEVIKKAGMKFAICYEDRTIQTMVNDKHLDDGDVYTYAQGVMSYLQSTWFTDDAYMKINGQPVLFIFGPIYFVNAGDWANIFSVLNPQPIFISLDAKVYPSAVTGYPWPPMSASVDGLLKQPALIDYLNSFYKKTAKNKIRAASAFPGFWDIYYQAGVGPGYGYLDSKDGEIFKLTLDMALASNPDIIQLVTWNDYGEGTNIEPTVEFGYRYLEIIQETRRSLNPEFTFQADDLQLPLKLFNLRKQYQDDTGVIAQLDQAYQSIIAGDLAAAGKILDGIPAKP